MAGFNANLRRLMKKRGLGPTSFGRLIGTHRNNVYRLMYVVKKPTPWTVHKCARALEVDPQDLVENWEEVKDG